MPSPRSTYLSCRPSGAGSALLGMRAWSLARFCSLLEGVYTCLPGKARPVTDPVKRVMAEAAAANVKRMTTRVGTSESCEEEIGIRKVG